MGSLFSITSEMKRLEEILSDFDGDVTELQKEEEIALLFANILQNEDEFESKVDSYIYLMAEFEARSEYRAQEARRLQILAKRDEAEKQRLEDRLLMILKGIDKRDFQTRLHKVKIAFVGGKRSLDVDEQVNDQDFLNAIQDRFLIEVPEQIIPAYQTLDKDAVRNALEAGEELSFATLRERKEKLKIS